MRTVSTLGLFAWLVSSSSLAEPQLPLTQALAQLQPENPPEIQLPASLRNERIALPAPGSGATEILANYNYTITHGQMGRIERIVISGLHHAPSSANGASTIIMPVATDSGDLLAYDISPRQLPAKYQSVAPGTVQAIQLPTEQLRTMALGDRLNLNLPEGNFDVIHDNRFEHENGEVTWVGYVATAGKQYRVIITIGDNGSLGQIMTPSGVYSIDLEDNRNWLVKTREVDPVASL